MGEPFDGTLPCWTRVACSAIERGVEPSAMRWTTSVGSGDLFAGVNRSGETLTEVAGPGDILAIDDAWSVAQRAVGGLSQVSSARAGLPPLFERLARSVACHRDPERWASLYVVLWRLRHGEPHLLAVATDPAVHRLVMMHRAVRRASHKMKAFVRFRRAPGSLSTDPLYVAWFEPAHLVVERTAPFFARRFASMRWSILTPDRSAHWDRERLEFGPGVSRSEAPTEDALEDLWRTYYANIFNPARLNPKAMRTEMPAKYWVNLPEAKLIPDLRAAAPARVRAMLDQVASAPEPLPAEMAAIDAEASLPLDEAGEWDPVHDPGVRVSRDRDRVSRRDGWCRLGHGAGVIDLGVAGWTDPSLLARGAFYPDECRTPDARLRYYATRFPMVEVDATYYALPARSTAAAWASRTPEGFTFDVKAHALMTGHPSETKRLPDWIRRELPSSSGRIYGNDLPDEIVAEIWRRFRSALDPLRTAGKLGAIMLQFPRWFEPTRAAAEALRRARHLLGSDLGTVELRNRAWMEGRVGPRTLDLLRELGLSYVIVDAPQGMQSSMPPVVAITDPRLVVFRLHGRRAATWEAKNDPVTERYRYLYDHEQLAFWAPRIMETACDVARVHVTFNNNHANYATTNASEMRAILEDAVIRG